MKKPIILFCLLSIFVATQSPLAAIKTATITWNMSDISEVTGYKMYYSYNSSMSNKQLACMTNDPAATSLTCENINLQQSPVYFVIAALLPEDEAESRTEYETFLTAISQVQGFQIEAPASNTPPEAVITASTTSGQAPLTVHFDASQSSDSDGNIASYSWNFGDGSSASTAVATDHTFSTTGSFHVTLTVTDNEGTTATDSTTISTNPSSPSTYMINFQPGDSETPAGFVSDNGYIFDTNLKYGWTDYMPNTRDRDNQLSPDQSYDTNIIYIDSASEWNISLGNGDYTVTVCAGDPSFPTGPQKIQIEGTTIIDGELSLNQRWIERTTSVTVTDGQLTMTFLGSDETKICWIKINPAGE